MRKGYSWEEIDQFLAAVNFMYDTNIKKVFRNDFTISVLEQFKEKKTLTEKQLKALQNMDEGINDYNDNAWRYNNYNRREGSNRSRYGGYCNEDGPWEDMGQMGYLN